MLLTSVGLLPIRLFPSTSTLLSRATSTSSPVIRIRNSHHFPIPSSRSMSSVAAEEARGKEEEEKSVPDDNNNGGDLVDTWPTGSVVAQGCHASVAAIWAHRDTVSYLSDTNIDSMHKVALEVKGEIQIRNLSEKPNTSYGWSSRRISPRVLLPDLTLGLKLLPTSGNSNSASRKQKKEKKKIIYQMLCCVI